MRWGSRVLALEVVEKPSIPVMCAFELIAMPAATVMLAKLVNPPPFAAGMIVLFTAMPTGCEQ